MITVEEESASEADAGTGGLGYGGGLSTGNTSDGYSAQLGDGLTQAGGEVRPRKTAVRVKGGPPRPVPGEAVYSSLSNFRNDGATYILVVEKECIFRRLVEDCVWERVPCILVTGCGFPDLATRAFVHRLHTRFKIPVLGLSDWNPFGMAIMLCYRFGSKTMPEANQYRVPLRWLGLRHDDLETYKLPASALQPMTGIDETRAAALLRDGKVTAGSGEEWDSPLAYEAKRFLERREKMELEGVLGRGLGFLAASYLPAKVRARDFI